MALRQAWGPRAALLHSAFSAGTAAWLCSMALQASALQAAQERWEVGGKNVGLGAICEVEESRQANVALGRQHRELRKGGRDKLEANSARPSSVGGAGADIREAVQILSTRGALRRLAVPVATATGPAGALATLVGISQPQWGVRLLPHMR